MNPQHPDPFLYFRIESGELISTLTRGCLALERGDEAENVIHELNRAAHSLKGAARIVELFGVGDAAHSLEDAFSLLQQHSATPTTDEVSGLLRQVDNLQQLLTCALSGDDDESELTEVPDAVSAVSAPSPATLRETRTIDRESQHGNTNVTGEQLARVSTVTLDEIGHCAGEALELGSRVSGWRDSLYLARRSVRIAAVMLDGFQQATEHAAASLGGNTATISPGQGRSSGRIDTVDLRCQIENVLQEIESGFEIIEPLARRLHRLSLETKFVSVGEFAHRFEKTIRGVAIETAKEVDFELTGGSIQFDRRVLQILTEPICHLLRNSVAHGIEAPSERKDQGKPAKGAVGLLFEKSPDMIRVIVQDDGAGLDVDGIRDAAGVDGAQPTTNEDGNITEFIFRPGLTTKTNASMSSGRGVGLDVVRNAVHQLRGTVKVESNPGCGCCFILEVPARLDVMNVFVLRVGGQDLLIPLARMARIFAVTPESLTNHAGTEAIIVDERAVQLVSLGSVLDIPQSSSGTQRLVAIIKTDGDLLALEIDSFGGRRKVVIKNVGPQLASCAVLAGAAIMSDGRPGFLLDTNVLSTLAKDSRFHIQRIVDASPTEPASVLVVDDSLTTRMLEQALLVSAGYRVTLATDGLEALGFLAASAYDLIIIDFEMPGMNGVDVAKQVRAIPERSHIPIIMLTSLADDETKRAGLAAGMQAFLVKGEFDQTEFLSKVRGLIGKTEGGQ